MRLVPLACLCVFLAAAGDPPSVATPKLHANDTWTYVATVENRTGWHQARVETILDHASAMSIAISNKQVGAPTPPVEEIFGPDWSRIRSVNGKETIVNRPLAFPLTVGKTWTLAYMEEHPNRAWLRRQVHLTYTVTGWEDVTVPAGTFHALKIEGEGQWTGTTAPHVAAAAGSRVDAAGATTVTQTARSGPTTVTGRIYRAYWYVPAVKKWAKSQEEDYTPGGIRNERLTNELEAFKVGG